MNTGAKAYQLWEKLNYNELQEACTGFHRVTGMGLRVVGHEGNCILSVGDEPLGPAVQHCLLPGAKQPEGLMTPVVLKVPVPHFQLYNNPLGLTEALFQPDSDHPIIGYIVVGQFLTDAPPVVQLHEQAAALRLDLKQIELTISTLPAFDDQQLPNTLALLVLLIGRFFQKPTGKGLPENDGARQPAAATSLIQSNGRLLFDTSAQAMWIATTTDGQAFKLLAVNAAYSRITGIDAHAIVDRDLATLTDLAPEASLQKQITLFREVIRTGKTITYEETNQVPTGTITVEVTLRLMEPTVEGSRQILGVARDITHLRAYANLLKQSEESYYELFESSPEAILIINPETNQIIDANRKAIQLTGFSHDQLITKNLKELHLTDQPETDTADCIAATTPWRGRLLSAENTLIPVEISAQSLTHKQKEVVLYVLRNISQQIHYEKAITESERKFRDLAENAPAIVFRYTFVPEPHFEYVSQNCTIITGYTPEEHYADPLLGQKIIHPDDLMLLDQYMNNPQPKSLMLRWIHKDGTIRWTSQQLHQVTDEQGAITTIEGYVQDITAEHNATEALKVSEHKFREYIEKAPDGIIICDKTGRYVEVNPATCSITGYSESELLQQSATDLLSAKEKHLGEEHFARIRTSGTAESIFKIHRKDGAERMITVTTAQLNNNRYLSFVKDVTREREMMETLCQSENDYRRLFEQAHDAIMIFRASDEVILEVNQHTCEIYGFPKAELIGRSLVTLSFDPSRGKEKINKTLIEKNIENFETRHYRKDGSIVVLEARASVIDYQGEQAVLSINRDITARRHAEDLNRLDTELDNLLLKLYNVSMDLSDDELFEMATNIAIKTTGSGLGFCHRVNDDQQVVSITSTGSGTGNADNTHPKHLSADETAEWLECVRSRKPFPHNRTDGDITGPTLPSDSQTSCRYMGLPVYCNGKSDLILSVSNKTLDYEPADMERLKAITIELTKILEKRTILNSLKQSEEQYRSLIDQIHVGIIVHDVDTRIVLHNEAAARLLRLNTPNLLGKEAADPRWHFIDEQGHMIPVEEYPVMRVINTGMGIKDVVIGIASNQDDAVNWVIVNAFPEKDETGQLQQIVVSTMDITQRKEAEDKLLLLHERIHLATHAAPIGIWDFNLVNNSLVWDEGMFQLYDTDPTLFKGTFDDWKQRVHPDDLPMAFSALEKALTGEKEFDIEFRIRLRNNDIHYLRGFAIVVRNPEGTPLRMTGINIDITARRVAEQTLKESDDFNKTLLHTIPFGIDIVDEEGNILFMNENLSRLFPDGSSNKKCWEIYRDDTQQCPGCPLRKEIAIGETKVYESFDVMGGRIFEINHTGMWFQGKKALLEIFRDITDRKKAEADLVAARNKAEEVSLLRSRLLANLSHEIRTPLNGNMGFSEYLNSEITDEAQLDMIRSIYESGSRLLDTLTGILDLSAYESTAETISMKPVNINALAENRIVYYQPVASAKGLPIELIASSDNPVTLTREDLVSKIIGHLISNAIKFTKTGKITVSTGLSTVESTDYLFVKVTDTGIGIAEEHMGLIFEEFRQVSEGINRAYEGTGLGLHISQRFAQILGGRITVDSQPGAGSTFTLWIPHITHHSYAETNHQTKLRQENAPKQEESVYQKKPLVLLVEDDDPSAILAEIILKKQFDLHRVTTGEEAIACVRRMEVNAVLMDINLGSGISGIVAVEKIHETDGNSHLPIAAVTANALDGHREEYLSRGCSHYLTKPYRREELLRIINEMLSGHQR